MIERIASHVGDFTPRLQSNTRALYQYCPMPVIVFPQLETELFCNIYYLRHLCDTSRFPDWPIKDPVSQTLGSFFIGRYFNLVVPLYVVLHRRKGGSVAEWLACWTQAQKGLDSNRSCDAVR